MAVPNNTAWEVEIGGSDSNAGGFVYGLYLSSPSAPTLSIGTGGSLSAQTYYVIVTYTNGISGIRYISITSIPPLIYIGSPASYNAT